MSAALGHKEVLKQANAAVAAGDTEGFLSFCADDSHWTFVGDRTLVGKEAIRAWMNETYAAGPPDNDVTDWIEDGDLLSVVGTITVRDKTGQPTRSTYCDVWRLRNGKLAELRAFVIEHRASP